MDALPQPAKKKQIEPKAHDSPEPHVSKKVDQLMQATLEPTSKRGDIIKTKANSKTREIEILVPVKAAKQPTTQQSAQASPATSSVDSTASAVPFKPDPETEFVKNAANERKELLGVHEARAARKEIEALLTVR